MEKLNDKPKRIKKSKKEKQDKIFNDFMQENFPIQYGLDKRGYQIKSGGK